MNLYRYTNTDWSNGLKQWLLRLNKLKCKVFCFGRSNPEHKYKIDETELFKIIKEKDLSVHITNEAKPSLQCIEVDCLEKFCTGQLNISTVKKPKL